MLKNTKNKETETPFTDLVKGKITTEQFNKQTDHRPLQERDKEDWRGKGIKEPVKNRPLHKFEGKAELENELDDLSPEDHEIEAKTKRLEKATIISQTKQKGKPVKKEVFTLKAKKGIPEQTKTEIKPNPNLIPLVNLRHNARIYFDKQTTEDFLYKFGKDYPKSRLRLDNPNIYSLLAYCLARIYGNSIFRQKNPRIYITKKMRKKIRGIQFRMKLREKHVI